MKNRRSSHAFLSPPGVCAAAFLVLALAVAALPGVAAAVTASFHGAPEAHNGKKLFVFEIRFSEDFDGLRLGALKRALQVTGGRVVDVKRTVRGENGGVTVRVRPSSTGDLTITLAEGTAGGGSLTVPGPASEPEPVTPPVSEPEPQPVSEPDPQPVPAPTPLTASFHGLPDKHDGKLISFEIRFSEEFDGLKLGAIKQALQVTGGRVVDVKRTVRGENGSVTVRVRPSSLDPIAISLPATADCAAAGAICSKAGEMLSGSVSANIISTSWGTGRTLRRIQLPPDQYPVSSRTISPSPPTYPSIAGAVVKMNSFGIWADEMGALGGHPNTAPNFEVREYELSRANTDVGYAGCPIVGSCNNLKYDRLWYQYPSVAKTDTAKTRVLVQVHRLGPGIHNAVNGGGKTDLQHYVDSGGRYTEFFVANSFLDAKGTLAQPDVTATFTGKVIAIDSAAGNIGTRGELIGGDASVTATLSGGAVTGVTVKCCVWPS